MDIPSSASDTRESEQLEAAAAILASLERAETADAFFRGLLHGQLERSEAMHGVVWLRAPSGGQAVRLLCEEPARVGPEAAEAWRHPLARQAASVFLSSGRHVERVSEPAGRLLEGRVYWAVGLPVPVGQKVMAVVTLVMTGGEQHVLDYARVAAESVASQGLLYGTLEAGQRIQERYDEMRHAWDLAASVHAGYPNPEHMALALVNKAKEFCGVQRVSLGWARRGKVKLVAISEQDYIDRRTNLARALVAAMKEAQQEERAVIFPEPAGDAAPAPHTQADPADLFPAHAALADLTEDNSVATYPLAAGGEVVAVVVFERQEREPFTPAERRLQSITCEQVGPSLGLARQNARGLLARSRDAAMGLVEMLTGRGHVAAKLIASALLVLVAIGVFGRWPLKIKGNAQIAPAQRRVYAAPFDRAILRETMVLPGQLVKKGSPLFRFETEELDLALREARSKLRATEKKAAVYEKEHKIAQQQIAQAECDELAAQIQLLEHRISQAIVRAEFDGVVLSGDLRQHIGSPFQMGQTLLEVAPLDELLLLVEVDQGDIGYVEVDAEGTFATKARPDVKLPFEVEKIRPMSEAREQANVFVVEACLQNTEGWLRPGMEAAANIHAGSHNTAWVFTRKAVDWLRLKLFF